MIPVVGWSSAPVSVSVEASEEGVVLPSGGGVGGGGRPLTGCRVAGGRRISCREECNNKQVAREQVIRSRSDRVIANEKLLKCSPAVADMSMETKRC